MSDKSFEERVREELGSLRLTPETQVWENIYTKIHTEKKRRWLAWPIVLLGIGSVVGLYYQLIHSTTSHIRQNNSVLTKSDINTNTNTKSVEKNSGTKSVQYPTILSAIETRSTQHKSAIQDQKNKPHTGKIVAPVADNAEKKLEHTILVIPESSPQLVTTLAMEKQATASPTKLQSVNDSQLIPEDTLAMQANALTNISDHPKPEPTPVFTSIGETERQTTSLMDSVQHVQGQPIKVEKNERKKWHFFGVAEAGMSAEIYSLHNAWLVLDASMKSRRESYGNLQPANITGSSVPVRYKIPSRNAGPAFGLAIQAIKPMAKKWDIGILLGYNYYSSGVGVGTEINNSTVNSFSADSRSSYYLSKDSVLYINKHHFLMAQIELYRRFRLSNTISLRWSIAGGAGILLFANTLHFDEDKGILYRNRSLLPTLQPSISTGLDIGMGKKQRLFIGPRFSYLPGAGSKDGTSRHHIFNAGIRAAFLLSQKKK